MGKKITERPTEVRSIERSLETRSGGSGRRIGGYGAVFDTKSRDLGGFLEIVDSRAFNKSLGDGGNVLCRFDHSNSALLGTTQAKTLRLWTDAKGLLYEVDLPECRADIFEMVQRGDLRNSSFAFQAFDESWEPGPGGTPVRTLLSCRLIDVSPVVDPAYFDATVGLRSLAAFVDADPEEVFGLARDKQLRKLFTRTDVAAAPNVVVEVPKPAPTPEKRGLSGADALVKLMDRRYSEGRPQVGKNGVQAVVEIQGKRWADETLTPLPQDRSL
jgi:uncharacterized protein